MIKKKLYHNRIEALDMYIAETARERRRGLLNIELDDQEGLLLKNAPIIHMLGMKMNLRLLFLDRNGKVKKVLIAKKGFRFYAALSKYCLEVKENSLKDVVVGDMLSW